MELAGILMAYETLVSSGEARASASEALASASSRFARCCPMFEKTYAVVSFARYASEILGAFSERLAACGRG